MRIHELAKKYSLKSDDVVQLLERAGFKIKNDQAEVDFEMLGALEKTLNWSRATKKKSKARSKTAKAVAEIEADAKVRVKVKVKVRRKAEPVEEKVEEAKPADVEAAIKTAAKTKTKTTAKAETKTTAKAETKAKSAEKKAGAKVKAPADKTGQKPSAAEVAPAPPAPKRPSPETKKAKKAKKSGQSAQQKAVRESVRRTLAKLETTRKTKRRKTKASDAEQVDLGPVRVQERSSVAMLAGNLGVDVDTIIERAEELGISAAPAQELERDVIELIADELGRTVEIESAYAESRLRAEAKVDPAKLKPRAPIITVMGHVDHGKTSILDYIRQSRVAAGEAGGITQHVGAYDVDLPTGKITFIDTPGHEAFTAMRARGAQLTDIVVLVVAADDGVMPQTIEAINHTRAAGVPMVVAVNKIDLASANPANVKQQLMQHEVVLEEYGGETVAAELSAKTGEGIDKLLEMILLQAELQELQADPTARAQGVVVEVKKEEGRGIMCTVLVQQGTLRVGDVFVTGNEYGKVRALVDYRGKTVKVASPSDPVVVLGANGLPLAGDSFIVVKNEREAREISAKRQDVQKATDLAPSKKLTTLEDLYAQIQEGERKELRIIVKADTSGSEEALRDSLVQLSLEEVDVKIIHSGVGFVSESDVLLASSSEALIIVFNSKVSPGAKELAEREKVDVRSYEIIYEMLQDIEKAAQGMLEPIFVERVLGRAEVRKIFRASKVGLIAGSMVTEGAISRNASSRVLRGEEVVFEGKIDSLKRFRDDVKEVLENFECGIGLSGFNDLQENDIIEAYVVEEKARVF